MACCPESAIGSSSLQSMTITGSDLIELTELWRSDAAYFAPDGTPSSFQFVNLLQDGFYVADFSIYWDQTDVFGVGENPYIEPACQIAGSPDVLVNTLVPPYWDDTQGWIGGEQLSTSEVAHQQVTARFWFNYEAAELDPDFGVGLRLRSTAASSPKDVGGAVAVTRLGPALTQAV